VGDVISGDVFAWFLLMLPGPGRQPNEPFQALSYHSSL